MGYNRAKKKMKKYLLIVLLTLAGSVIVGNNINQQESKDNTMKTEMAENDVEYWKEDEVDEFGNYLGTDIMIRNNYSKCVSVTVVYKLRGENRTHEITDIVPGYEEKSVYFSFTPHFTVISCTHRVLSI